MKFNKRDLEMKKILYLCCLLLMANQTIAAAAVAEDRPSIGARLCALFAFQRPAARAVAPAPSILTEVKIDPKTLEEAVKTWRICRVYKRESMFLPSTDIFTMFDAEDAARIFITNSINAGMAAETKEWLKLEIGGTDPEMGMVLFHKLYR